MKKIFLNTLATMVLCVALVGCKNEKKTSEEVKTMAKNDVASNYVVDGENSKIYWEANKIVGGHKGTINVTEGDFTFKGDDLVGGKFVFDVTTLKNTDIPAEDENNAKLVGHLLSGDFFDAEKFPKATFEIVSVSGKTVNGNLTIKGITKPVSFELEAAQKDANASIHSAVFTIDRTEWDIKYNSGKFADPAKLGDYLIKDDVEIKIDIAAKKA